MAVYMYGKFLAEF